MRLPRDPKRKLVPRGKANTPQHGDFDEVLRLINAARIRAVAAVNTTLIELYWQIGEYISRKIESAAWGEGVVEELAAHIGRSIPACGVTPAVTYSECGSFSRLTGGTKKCQHC